VPTEPPVPTQSPAPTQPPPTQPPISAGQELLFLRAGDLWAFALATGDERKVTPGVREFVASPDGALIALVREQQQGIDLWSVRRDGSGLKRLTNDGNALVEASPSWSPNGAELAFAAASSGDPSPGVYPDWSLWCAASSVRVLDLQTGSARSLGPGCDPAFSPDGRRIAYAAPPTKSEPEMSKGPTAVNSIRLVNRLGQNGWDFAKADGVDAPEPRTGRVLYAPAWSPDGAQVVYHRFLGYQALVDINLSAIAGSFEGGGQVIGEGAGWMLPARFAPDGKTLAITDNHFSDPRGFGGYDNWYVSVVRLEGTREIAMPSGTIVAVGQQVDRLPRGQSAAWAPDGKRLAVELPPGWRPGLPNDEPFDAGERPGELWLWAPGQNPSQKLVEGVDFASPLAWLP
jgi:Tol biopolymer transport system component